MLVQGICDLPGFDPLYLACEGRLLTVVAVDQAHAMIRDLRRVPGAEQSAIIGSVITERHLSLVTKLAGERFIAELESEPLPRIC